jgi:hypothetical protein
MKTYKTTSYDAKGNEIETMNSQQLDVKAARKFFKTKIAERSWNEVRIGRVTLDK